MVSPLGQLSSCNCSGIERQRRGEGDGDNCAEAYENKSESRHAAVRKLEEREGYS
jgi:hypothetical protein